MDISQNQTPIVPITPPLVPPSRNENKKYILIISAFAVIVLAFVGLAYYYYTHKDVTPVPQPISNYDIKDYNPIQKSLQDSGAQIGKAPTENPLPPANLAAVIAKFYQDTNIAPAPKIAGSNTIDQSKLPAELLALINPKQNYLSVEQVNFEGNLTGYVIGYKIPALIYQNQRYYDLGLRDKGWTIVKAESIHLVGLVTLQNNNYNVLVEQSVIDAQNINVIVTVIKK